MTQMGLGFAEKSSNEALLAEIDRNVGDSSRAFLIWSIPNKQAPHLGCS